MQHEISDIYRTATYVLIAALTISTVFHPVLLISDSPAFRQWVLIQIGIQVSGVVLLFVMLKYKKIALFMLFPLSLVFTYINAVYTNYGHLTANVMGFLAVWTLYGILIVRNWDRFRATSTAAASSSTM